jgi:hypothetical protein
MQASGSPRVGLQPLGQHLGRGHVSRRASDQAQADEGRSRILYRGSVRPLAIVVFLALTVACGRVEYNARPVVDASSSEAGGPDAGSDPDASDASAGTGDAGPCTWGEFGTPMRVAELSSPDDDGDPVLARGGTLVFFTTAGVIGPFSIYSAARADLTSPFGPRIRHDELLYAGVQSALAPAVTSDGLELVYLADTISGGDETGYAERAATADPFSLPSAITISGDPGLQGSFFVDDLTLVYAAGELRPGVYTDLAIARRADRASPFVRERMLDELNTTASEGDPTLTRDGLEIIFVSDSVDPRSLFRATRPTTADRFGPASLVDELHVPGFATGDPSLSDDGTTLYFSSNRPGSTGDDIWVATRSCTR